MLSDFTTKVSGMASSLKSKKKKKKGSQVSEMT